MTTVLTGVWPGAWDVTDRGIIFVTGPLGVTADVEMTHALERYDFADRQTRRIGELPFPVTSRGYSPPRLLTASADGRWLIVSHMDTWERDIMVTDHYR